MTDDTPLVNAAEAAADLAQDAGFSLSQVDVDHVFQLLSLLTFIELAQFVLLVLLAGLVFGGLVTRKWSV